MMKKHKLSIGLDIGTNSVKLIGVNTRRKPTVAFVEILDIVAEGRVHRIEKSDETNLIAAVKEVIERIPYPVADLNVTLSSLFSNLVYLTTPKMEYEALKKVIHWQLNGVLPVDPADCEVDFTTVGQTTDKGKVKILAGAIEKSRLNQFVTLLRGIGINPEIIELDTLAILESYLQTESGSGDETLGLLQLGASHSSYTIIPTEGDAEFLFLSFGGNALNDILADNLGMSFTQAEEFRLDGKLTSLLTHNNSEAHTKCLYDINEAVAVLIESVQRFNTGFQLTSENKVDRLLLCGGLANEKFIVDMLNEVFPMEVTLWDPVTQYLSQDDDTLIPDSQFRFSAALGAALR